MPVRRFTDDNIDGFVGSPRRQETFFWDKATPGLGLRITSKGKRSWVFRYALGGRDRRMTLAQYSEKTLVEARQAAIELRSRVDKGEDVADAKVTSGAEGTLGGLWDKLRRDYMPRRSSGHQRNVQDHFERLILPKLGANTPLTELTWEDVDRWHQSLKGTPATGNLALASLSMAYNMARRWGLVPRNMANPASDHERHATGKPGKPFTKTEMKAIGKALKKEPDPVQRAALTVFLLTGLRPGEVCRLRWQDIGEGGVTYLGRTKTGPRYCLLSTRAEELIRELPEIAPWCFPSSRNTGEPLGGLESDDHGLGEAWKRVRAASKVKGRLYDARHSWISAAAAEGIGDDVRRLLAGHVSSSNGAHGDYLHVTEALRPMADKVAEKIAEALEL